MQLYFYKNNALSFPLVISNIILPLGMTGVTIAHVSYLLQQHVNMTNSILAIVAFFIIGASALALLYRMHIVKKQKAAYEDDSEEKTAFEHSVLGINVVLIFMISMIVFYFINSYYAVGIGEYCYFSYVICLLYFGLCYFFYFSNRYQADLIRTVTTFLMLALAISFSFPTALNMNLTYKMKQLENSGSVNPETYWSIHQSDKIRVLNGKYYIDNTKVDLNPKTESIVEFSKVDYTTYKLTINYSGVSQRKVEEGWEKKGDVITRIGPWMKDRGVMQYGYTPIESTDAVKSKQVGNHVITLGMCEKRPNYKTRGEELKVKCLTLYDEKGEVIVGGIEYLSDMTLANKKITGVVENLAGIEQQVTFDDSGGYKIENKPQSRNQKIGDVEITYDDVTKFYKVIKNGTLVYTGTLVYYDDKTETFNTRFLEPDYTIQRFNKNMELIETLEAYGKFTSFYYWEGEFYLYPSN